MVADVGRVQMMKSPDELTDSCLRRSSRLDAGCKTHLSITSHGGRHDELKEWLTRRWESSETDSGSPVTPAGVKRKASDVLETPADSTDDVFTRGVARGKCSGGKVSKSNILLASLLATRATAEQPVVNTLSIGSMASVTPQNSLLRRASTDQLHSVVGELAASGAVRSSSSVSSVTSLSAAGHRPHTQRSYSHHVNPPVMAETSLLYQDSREEFASADVMDSGTGGGGGALSVGSVDDKTLISQFEQFFSSQGSSMLTELEGLLGDSFADLTNSLFVADQSDVSNQAPMTGVDSQTIKQEPQSGSQSQQSACRSRGSGMLGQLLDADGGASSVTSSQPQRPSSLAVSSAYFCHGTNAIFYYYYSPEFGLSNSVRVNLLTGSSFPETTGCQIEVV